MKPEQWALAKQIFQAAIELAPAMRPQFLREACANNDNLRIEIEKLLASNAEAQSFMEQAAIEEVAETVSEPPENLRAGDLLNHYEIVKKIGAGGMGEVYLAEDRKLDRRVAIKILNEKLGGRESNLQRFIREAKAASVLNHPNILVIHEIGKIDETDYIVSEFIEGQTLRQLLREKTLSLPEVLEIAIQIAGALTAAHAARIVHRDIKPENIILRPDGYVKILDFGLAKLITPKTVDFEDATVKQSNTAHGVILGTINYMSPEQAKGESVDERTDVFSLGVLLYEMIAGKTPFAGDSLPETFANLIKAEPLPLSHYAKNVSDELQSVVDKTICKNKNGRYQSMRELLFDLKNLKNNSSLERQGAAISANDNDSTKVLLKTTGEAREQTDEDKRGFLRNIGWSRFAAIAAVLMGLLGAIYFAFLAKNTATTSLRTIKSVMVLPLKNLGSDVNDEYLSDGITDELTSKLTKLKTVRVVAPSSAMRYKNSTETAKEIGREMNVEAVIEGTVRKQANKFRVSLSLVNAADGFEVWSDSDFDGDISNLLDAQSQIAELMASRLKGELTQQEKSSLAAETTTNADAYELFLKGKEQYRTGQTQLARDLFSRAIQLDPNFADAYAWRGRAVYSQFKTGSGDRATLDAALANANRALQIDPNLISARRTLINIYHSTGQYEEGLRQGKLALETNANDFDAIEGTALAYFRAGMIDKAIPLYERAVTADPMDSGIRVSLARSYLYAGKYQKGVDVLSPTLKKGDDANLEGAYWMAMMNYQGLRQFDNAIEMGQSGTSRFQSEAALWLDYSDVLRAAGKPEEARQILQKIAQTEEAKLAAFENVRTRIWVGFSYASLGEREKALEQVSRAAALEPNDAWTLYQIGAIHAILNDRREAVDYLKQSIANGWLGVHYLNFDSNPNNSLANLRDDAEFQKVRADLQKKVDELAKRY